MIRQKSFDSDAAKVYLVPTPIGNLNEMTPRALEILAKVDYIAAEDTRNTKKLLMHYQINTPLLSAHEHNQEKSIPMLCDLVAQGKSIAVVSDAGYPLVSDPGQYLVEQLIAQEVPVISVSGANAAINALVASGLSCYHYLFYGFLDSKSSKRKKELEGLKAFPYTLIFYEAPHRIAATCQDLLTVFGDRQMVLARELTKLHEEYIRGTISEILSVCDSLKGEMVLIVEGNKEETVFDMDAAIAKVLALSETMKLKEACKQVAQEYHASKNELYQEALKRRG